MSFRFASSRPIFFFWLANALLGGPALAAPAPSAASPAAAPPAPAATAATAAAEPGPALGRPSFQRLGDEDDGAIAQTAIESLALDPGGELWIGTQDGAAMYDGRTFREVMLPQRLQSNWIHAIQPFGETDVYFATDAGIARRRAGPLGEESWHHFTAASGLRSEVVKALAASGDDLYAGTERGLVRLEGERFAPLSSPGLPPSLDVTRLAAAPGDVLWIGTETGLGRLDGGRYFAEKLFAGQRIEALWADTRGVLAAVPGAVYRRDAGSTEWRPAAGDPAAFADWPVAAIVRFARIGEPAERSGEQLFFGGDRGLRRLAGGHLATWGYAEGMPTGSIHALAAAPGTDSDLLFIGPGTGGLVRTLLNGWNVLDARGAPLPRDDINAIGEVRAGAETAYFFGTETGVARYAAGRWDLFTRANSDLPSDNVNGVLQAAGGDVYFATEGGLLVTPARAAVAGPLRGRAFLPENSPLPHAAVLTLLRAEGGGVYIGTRGGLARHGADGSWEITREGQGALPDRQVYALAELGSGADRQLWVGTRRGGLARFAGGRWERFQPGSSPLPHLWVNCLEVIPDAAGRPLLWVGTDAGAVRLDPAAPAAPWLALSETTEPALPNQVIYQIRLDSRGRLLFFTNRGVARAPGPNGPLSFEVLTTNDGLPANDFTQWGSMIDRHGRLWAGSSRGLAIYDAAFESATLSPPRQLRFKAVEVDGGDPARRSLQPEAILTYDQRLLLRYGLPRLAGGEGTTYRTQLIGLEAEPTSPTTVAERLFSPLPGGDYVFRVEAIDAKGEAGLPLELAFAVEPAPWLHPWALALYVALFGGLLLTVLNRREARQRANQAALEALVDERTTSLRLSEAEARGAREEAEEANRVKGRFLANMSHELRTPLNGVIGLTSLLERTMLDDNQRRYLENLRSSGQHLLALVSDVLDFEKIAAGNLELDPEPIVPAAFLESVTQAARPEAEAKGLDLRLLGLAELPPLVAIDARRLRQVLLNLLSNAVKFTPVGEVVLEAWAEPAAAGAGPEALRFVFRVTDTGIGIPHERLGRLFKPFSQVDSSTTRIYGGTGLGLAICKALVERMGGSIEVASEPGRGSTFQFTCLAELAAGGPGDTAAKKGGRPSGRHAVRRVLLAEDQPINQIVAVAMLEELGCEVTVAANGREAVDKAKAESFDLIVLDLQMPEMDGLEAAGAIRRAGGGGGGSGAAGPPIVLLTADVRPEVRDRSEKEGIDGFLAKPVLLEDFAELLRRLEERAAG